MRRAGSLWNKSAGGATPRDSPRHRGGPHCSCLGVDEDLSHLGLVELVNPQLLRLGPGHRDAEPGHVDGGLDEASPGDVEVAKPLSGRPVASHLTRHSH